MNEYGGLSLIINERPVLRNSVDTVQHQSPHFCVVGQDETGAWNVLPSRRTTLSERLRGAGSRPCYLVDLSDQRRSARVTRTPLPCSDQAHRFEATLDVGFRVHDPVELVRSNCRDALSSVYGCLLPELRAHLRKFAISDADRAEEYVNRELRREIQLSNGITIFHCVVQLEPDASARDYIRTLTAAKRNGHVGQHNDAAAVRQAELDERLKDIEQQARVERERREREALGTEALDASALIREHVIRHPEDTAQAMDLLTRYQEGLTARNEVREQRWAEMMKFFVERDIIQQVDIPRLRGEMAQQIEGVAPSANSGAPEFGASVPLIAGGPVVWGPPLEAQQSGGSEAPTAAGPPTVGAVPVYIVVETSKAAADWTNPLNDALRSLHTVLCQRPDVSRAIRLSVLALSERVDERLPLSQVTWDTNVPVLSAGGGTHHKAMFEALLSRIPEEVDGLKQQVSPVRRPWVFFVGMSAPQHDGDWEQTYAALLDHRYRPTVVTCAMTDEAAQIAVKVASRGLGFAPLEGSDPATACDQFAALLRQTVTDLGQSLVEGAQGVVPQCPQGLRRLRDLHTPIVQEGN